MLKNLESLFNAGVSKAIRAMKHGDYMTKGVI